jgi:hypothetical protein
MVLLLERGGVGLDEKIQEKRSRLGERCAPGRAKKRVGEVGAP